MTDGVELEMGVLGNDNLCFRLSTRHHLCYPRDLLAWHPGQEGREDQERDWR